MKIFPAIDIKNKVCETFEGRFQTKAQFMKCHQLDQAKEYKDHGCDLHI